MIDLIETKTAPPSWMGNKIRRDKPLTQLDNGLRKRLTLVHAPAGYGKTSLLVQWRLKLAESGFLIAWLTLEKEDSEVKHLSRYITLAIESSNPEVSRNKSVAKSADLPPRSALSAIVNRLMREPRPVVLIFDDFHRAESPEVLDFFKSLIRLAPANCHFVIASRDYPSLDQSLLAAEDQLEELGAEDLAFSAAETEALLTRDDGIPVGSEVLQRIFERTEGWPMALQLTSLSLRRNIDHRELLERLDRPTPELTSYLSDQVLLGLTPEMQELVMRTALIDAITGEIVNDLCDRQDGWLVLERLEHQGVFLTATNEDKRCFRYHQLFAENMRERLARHNIGKFREIHAKAARWFANAGNSAIAINHAIHANDHMLIAAILEEAGAWRLIPNGLQNVAERGLSALSAALIDQSPRLRLMRIYLAIKKGQLVEARADYDALVGSSESAPFPADLSTEVQIVGDLLLEYENVPVTLDDLLAREALLRTLPTNDHLMLGNVCEYLGGKYYESGRLERAMEPTLAAREHHRARGSLYSQLFTSFLEARIRHEQGRLMDAGQILAAARSEIENCFGERSDLAANCSAFEAELLYDQNDLAKAAALLEWSLPHMEQSDGWVDVYAAAYTTGARIAAAQGKMTEARSVLGRARRLAQRRGLPQLQHLADLCEWRLLVQHGQADEAARAHSERLGLDAMADNMRLDSPEFRLVALSASLGRAKLALVEGNAHGALIELEELKSWGSQHGSGRLLIEVKILLASALHRLGRLAQAQASFDEAIGEAMFQGALRVFVDCRRFAEPLIRSAVRTTSRVDRFRDQFLKDLSRAIAADQQVSEGSGPLSAAEITVLTYLCQGYSNKEIARLIGMSPDTVKYRLKSLFKKLGVTKRRDAVSLTRSKGLAWFEGDPLRTV